MDVSATVAAAIAIGAAVVALAALATALYAWVKVRRVRTAQKLLLAGGRADIVDFAVALQARIDDLHRAVDEVAGGLARVDRRIDETVHNVAIVRYDAYEDAGGQQSASVALLDGA